ncbi:aldose 1-epimerase family protein [Mariniflexile litorale]|uniref:Aldose 1-epimerase family protein n=1 Tax=Mariniflexile litorale TaxID=3045158 RepID=A0AAU7EF04_9FLAO|nr:aldose 1-epimerase family protein [Mariniflexile sp. KMM 9835]MDQ8213341.1 aldose 1-epimerase family protein [Mariniflexile sp. KMM 9835]
MHTLENSQLKIAVNTIGAELCKITSVKTNTDFMWDADPSVWGSFAPNLFPIIGALKDDTYIFESQEYKLPKHGIVRNNSAVVLHEQTPNSLTFKLSYSENTLKIYPFKFEFYITYKLINNSIEVLHTIKNIDDKTMYFSVGGHPAFKCPVFENETYEDYFLEFEHAETSKTHLINMTNGLISGDTKPFFNNSNKLALTHDLFNADALIFKDLKSKKVALKSKIHGEILSVRYKDFTYLGIWAKPAGDYVCIEPWLGIADKETTNQDFKTKEGVLKLSAGNSFKARYTIEIHNSLV